MSALLLAAITRAAEAHNITPQEWQRLTSDKAFDYKDLKEAVRVPRNNDLSFLQKFIQGLFDFFGGGFGNALLWIVVVCVTAYILYKLFISKDNFLFGKRRKPLGTDLETGNNEEDIASTNWENLLQQSINAQDTRMAVRYSYMWLLQLLQHNELINYRIDKTNYDYYRDLEESGYKQPFKQLSRQYEYTWYGHYPLSPTAYTDYFDRFNTIKQQLIK